MSKIYVIIDADEVSDVDFSQVFEPRASSLRWNIDPARTKTFVKFEGSTPSFLAGKTQYNHAQILAILNTEEWSAPRE